jgi:hypothetical protein
MKLIRILFGFRRSPLRRGRYSEEVLCAGWIDLPAAFREIITRR